MSDRHSEYADAMTEEGVDPFTASGIGDYEEETEATQDASPSESENPQTEQTAEEQTQNNGQGELAPEEGQGEVEVTPEDFGYDSFEEAGKALLGSNDVAGDVEANLQQSYDNIVPAYTKSQQEVSMLREQIQQYQDGQIVPGQPQEAPAPAPTNEELQDMFLENPVKAVQTMLANSPELMNQVIESNPDLAYAVDMAKRTEGDMIANNIRASIPDFTKYENDVVEVIESTGNPQVFRENPDLIALVHRAVKAESTVKTLFAKVGRARLADVATDKANKGKANLGPGNLNPVPTKETTDRIGKYNINKADAEDFIDSQNQRVRRLG